MPDIYGKYALTELAKILNVTPAFINRIQRETGIGGSLGTKGKAASFNDIDVKIFQRIKILRKIEFSFEEIGEIWKLENNILGHQVNFTIQEYPTLLKWEKIPMIIHQDSFYWPHIEVLEDSRDKKIKEYMEKVGKLYAVADEVRRRHDVFISETEEMNKILKEFATDWERIIKAKIENISTDKQ